MPRRPVASDYYGGLDEAEPVATGNDLRAVAGYARAPLPPVHILIHYGLWPDDDTRDTTNDVTDDEIGAML
jgi:hypothetical protein